MQSKINLRSTDRFFSQSIKFSNIIWIALMKDKFGFPKDLASFSEDKRLLNARLKFIFWRKNSSFEAYPRLVRGLMSSIADDIANPHDLGWLVYTNNPLPKSYTDYLSMLTPDEKLDALEKAILARNEIVVDQLISYPDLKLDSSALSKLGLYAAESGEVRLVKKIMLCANQLGNPLNPNDKRDEVYTMCDAAVMSGSLELVSYFHDNFEGRPTFIGGIGSLKVLEYCVQVYGLPHTIKDPEIFIHRTAVNGSIELVKKAIDLCGGFNLSDLSSSACYSGNIELIDYCTLKSFNANFEALACSGNVRTCIVVLNRMVESNKGFRSVWNAFFMIYDWALRHGEYWLIESLEEYYHSVVYPMLKLDDVASQYYGDEFIEAFKSPILAWINLHRSDLNGILTSISYSIN